MTIKLPELSLSDKILRLLGKKRGVFIPDADRLPKGADVYAVGIKEPFLRALFRPKDKELPEGYIDIISHHDSMP